MIKTTNERSIRPEREPRSRPRPLPDPATPPLVLTDQPGAPYHSLAIDAARKAGLDAMPGTVTIAEIWHDPTARDPRRACHLSARCQAPVARIHGGTDP